MNLFIIIYLLLSWGILLFSIILSLKKTDVGNEIKDEKTTQTIEPEEYNQDISILYATLSERINEINQRLSQLYLTLSLKTKKNIVDEIELLKKQLTVLETDIDQLELQQEEKKIELQQQFGIVWNTFSDIKQLLEIDYESLVKQREYLKKEIEIQQRKYEQLVTNYNFEISQLNQIIEDLKSKYPLELLEKLQVEVTQKTYILEKIQKDYETLKNQQEQKIKILDDILRTRATEIEVWVNSIKSANEKELLELKSTVDKLRNEVESLNTELKSTVEAIENEQKEKSEIIRQLDTELKSIKSRQYEIETLKLREEFLKNEIIRLEKEYHELQNEYKHLVAKKGEEIKTIRKISEQQIKDLISLWQQQEKKYKLENASLERRITVLQKRKQKLANIWNVKKQEHISTEKTLQEKLSQAKLEFEKKKSEIGIAIREKISSLEVTVEKFKQKVDELKYRLNTEIQKYDDKIIELKKRSEVREERIKKDIQKSVSEYENLLYSLDLQMTKLKTEIKIDTERTKEDKVLQETKILSQKERLETLYSEIKNIVQKIEFAKTEVDKLNTEIVNIENQLYGKFEEILNNIISKKESLIEKLYQLLSAKEQLILKLPEIEVSRQEKNV